MKEYYNQSMYDLINMYSQDICTDLQMDDPEIVVSEEAEEGIITVTAFDEKLIINPMQIVNCPIPDLLCKIGACLRRCYQLKKIKKITKTLYEYGEFLKKRNARLSDYFTYQEQRDLMQIPEWAQAYYDEDHDTQKDINKAEIDQDCFAYMYYISTFGGSVELEKIVPYEVFREEIEYLLTMREVWAGKYPIRIYETADYYVIEEVPEEDIADDAPVGSYS